MRSHVFLVSFPGHGHVNPLLRLGKRLASMGLLVTLSTPKFFGKQMTKADNTPVGDGFLRFEFFDDGWDDDDSRRPNHDQYMTQLEHSCACFAAYYHYNRGLVPFPNESDPEIDVQLPIMPVLKHDEVPSFLHPSTPYAFLRTAILDQSSGLIRLPLDG
ncbi:hypothetical protein V6N11_074617 [Hibiscus sabdariffa]|uniref:Uncharacterized protein n=1 Tax=Hibiscus sabdariffa TaxID=183260 RepID=A0ABR2R436_9ROSI